MFAPENVSAIDNYLNRHRGAELLEPLETLEFLEDITMKITVFWN